MLKMSTTQTTQIHMPMNTLEQIKTAIIEAAAEYPSAYYELRSVPSGLHLDILEDSPRGDSVCETSSQVTVALGRTPAEALENINNFSEDMIWFLLGHSSGSLEEVEATKIVWRN